MDFRSTFAHLSSLKKYLCSQLIIILLFLVTPVIAVDFEQAGVYGSLDTTVSYGQTHRAQSPTSELIGRGNGGTAFTTNGDDGNLNYDDGLVSNTAKFTTELEVNYKNFGLFVRGTGFKDTRADDTTGDSARTDLTDGTRRLTGENLSLLDAYVWGNFDIGKMPFTMRVGEQVLSWGESTFIQNGINVINPVDVSKLRVPGAELKEALLPVGIVSAALGVTDNFSLEAYWQYDYERINIDPPGSYFSTNDFVGDGGTFVTLTSAVPDYINLGTGLVPLPDVPAIFPGPLTGVPGSALTARRSPDDRPDEGNEFGVALRFFVPRLNDSELGLYYIRYHSRLPTVNAISSTPAPGSPPFNNPAAPATYFIEYPEDIDLFGFSFNTELGNSGWALQGEYTFKQDVPLQVEETELLAAALHFDLINPAATSQLGVFGNGVVVPGFIERDVSQLQMTATKVFSNVIKADQMVLIGEFAVTHVHNMPDESNLRLDVAGTNLPGNAFIATNIFGVPVETNQYADETSAGYRIVSRLTYNNVIAGINFTPSIGWRHDISGNSPGPGANFIEEFKQVTFGITADYQNSWRADLSYTNFYGAGSQNLLQDRDFISLSLGYSF